MKICLPNNINLSCQLFLGRFNLLVAMFICCCVLVPSGGDRIQESLRLLVKKHFTLFFFIFFFVIRIFFVVGFKNSLIFLRGWGILVKNPTVHHQQSQWNQSKVLILKIENKKRMQTFKGTTMLSKSLKQKKILMYFFL